MILDYFIKKMEADMQCGSGAYSYMNDKRGLPSNKVTRSGKPQ